MAKAIKWQIPFQTNDPTNPTSYRIDIYAEGYTGNPIQLTAGPQPFVTEEDKNTDFFTPVRSQTGTIQVCTRMPNGGQLDINDLLPADNIAHPVRLVSIAANNAETIEWQGFMSCEAFSQAYTEVPEIFSFPVNSVLEAMASVQVDQTKLSGLNSVGATIVKLLEIFIDEAGISYFDEFYVPGIACGRNILSKKIDATVLFETKEYNNENSTTYIVSGLSLQDCLERISVYMGWVVREKSHTLYLMAANETTGYNRCKRYGELSPGGQITHHWTSDINDTAISTQNISAMKWMGTGHQRSIAAGAKSVEVVAKLEKYGLRIELPDCPTGSLSERYGELENSVYLYLLGNSDTTAYSHMSVSYYMAYVGVILTRYERYSNANFAQCFNCIAAGNGSSIKYAMSHNLTIYTPFVSGAFLAKYCWEDSDSVVAHDTSNALYCVFFPNSLQASWTTNPSDFNKANVGSIFSISSVSYHRCNNGYLRLFAKSDTIFVIGSNSPALFHGTDMNHEWLVAFELRFGDKWWNGSSWQSTQCTFNASMIKEGFVNNWESTMPILETDGLLIPVTEELAGLVTLKIWPMASVPNYGSGMQATLEMIFSELTVEYILPHNDKLTDRSANHYFRLLGTHFRDEISIDTNLASMLNNIQSPSLIMEDTTTPMKELNYSSSQSPDMRRPEVDLLNRLAAYYGAARQRLELEVKHPTAAPLPLLRLNGINDGKVYLPLSEKRDWKEEVCTLICFETPQ